MIRVAGSVVACLCASSFAQSTLQIDSNAMTTHSSGPFSELFSGIFTVLNTPGDPDVDGDARILDLLIDGVRQHSGGADAADFGFELNVEFDGGDIVSGTLAVSHDAFGSENIYTAILEPSNGGAILEVGDGTFIIAGMTFEGLWADPFGTFLNVDISPWGSVQPLSGQFADIAFTPDENNLDPDTDVDVFMVVPAPATGILVISAGLLGCRRRR